VKLRQAWMHVGLCLGAVLLVPGSVSACSIALVSEDQMPTSAELDQWARNVFGRNDTVVRARVIKGGTTGVFLVTASYKGGLRPFDTFSWNVVDGAACGPGTVAFLDSGVLAFDSKYAYRNHFDRFVDDDLVQRAFRNGYLPKDHADVSKNLAIVGMALFCISVFFAAKWLVRRRRFATKG
jgi:hypothetical protein